jgi:hypothetical protein
LLYGWIAVSLRSTEARLLRSLLHRRLAAARRFLPLESM